MHTESATRETRALQADMPTRTRRSADRRTVLLLAGTAAAVIGWALFRPELLFIDRIATDAGPPRSARVLASGSFHDVTHTGKGEAVIYALPDGRRTLRFTNFETSNGPDVHVYLVAADDATDHSTVTQAGFVALGPMQGNRGDQSYDVPATVDLGRYRAVTIWCKRFGVNFATAPLTPAQPPQ